MTEEDLKKIYCDVIKDEIDFDAVRKEKTAFMAEHFSGAPIELFHAGFAVPALCLCLIGVFFILPFNQQQLALKAPSHLADVHHELPAVVEEQAKEIDVTEELATYKEVLEDQERENKKHENEKHVEVTRLTSEAGSTMFYQRIVNDTNVTVVWVFPAGIA